MHNLKVLKNGSELMVVHRPKAEVDYKDYIPCRYCYGYMSKQSMWKHSCLLMPKTDEGNKIRQVRKGSVDQLVC
jgi:hypothetical protein